jgi:hypothetical protein
MDSDWNTSAVGEAGVLNLVGDDWNNMNENIKPLFGSRKTNLKKRPYKLTSLGRTVRSNSYKDN